jgi:hypothetical protein
MTEWYLSFWDTIEPDSVGERDETINGIPSDSRQAVRLWERWNSTVYGLLSKMINHRYGGRNHVLEQREVWNLT